MPGDHLHTHGCVRRMATKAIGCERSSTYPGAFGCGCAWQLRRLCACRRGRQRNAHSHGTRLSRVLHPPRFGALSVAAGWGQVHAEARYQTRYQDGEGTRGASMNRGKRKTGSTARAIRLAAFDPAEFLDSEEVIAE